MSASFLQWLDEFVKQDKVKPSRGFSGGTTQTPSGSSHEALETLSGSSGTEAQGASDSLMSLLGGATTGLMDVLRDPVGSSQAVAGQLQNPLPQAQGLLESVLQASPVRHPQRYGDRPGSDFFDNLLRALTDPINRNREIMEAGTDAEGNFLTSPVDFSGPGRNADGSIIPSPVNFSNPVDTIAPAAVPGAGEGNPPPVDSASTQGEVTDPLGASPEDVAKKGTPGDGIAPRPITQPGTQQQWNDYMRQLSYTDPGSREYRNLMQSIPGEDSNTTRRINPDPREQFNHLMDPDSPASVVPGWQLFAPGQQESLIRMQAQQAGLGAGEGPGDPNWWTESHDPALKQTIIDMGGLQPIDVRNYTPEQLQGITQVLIDQGLDVSDNTPEEIITTWNEVATETNNAILQQGAQ